MHAYVRSVALGHSLKPSFIKLNFFSPSPNLLLRITCPCRSSTSFARSQEGWINHGRGIRPLLTEHDCFIHFDERPLDHRLRQSVPLQCLIIEPHQHFELSERCLPKVLV